MKNRTFFIVIEGIDGSGKSSVAPLVVEAMQESFGNNVKLTFEPHDPSCAGVFIRQALMKRITNVPLKTLALAFATNRADHCNREIVPFLEGANSKPRIIICDRYYLSSLVYQSGDECTFKDIMVLNNQARRPDLTIFLNACDTTCYKRMRQREEDKELFEQHLSKTKKKYAEAIDFLRNQGEEIVEVEAEGSIAEVRNLILDAIHNNSPDWLSIGTVPLPLDCPINFFEQEDISVVSVAKKIDRFWNSGPICSEKQLSLTIEQMEIEIEKIVSSLDFNKCANLFFDILKNSGYEVLNKLPWIDLDAFEIRYKLPLGIYQNGAALLLGNSQRYDIIIKKVLGDKKVQTLDRMSDFLFIFDSNPSHLLSNHYERDIIRYSRNASLSPSVSVIGRKHLVAKILDTACTMLQEEFVFSFSTMPEFKNVLSRYRRKESSLLNRQLSTLAT